MIKVDHPEKNEGPEKIRNQKAMVRGGGAKVGGKKGASLESQRLTTEDVGQRRRQKGLWEERLGRHVKKA